MFFFESSMYRDDKLMINIQSGSLLGEIQDGVENGHHFDPLYMLGANFPLKALMSPNKVSN